MKYIALISILITISACNSTREDSFIKQINGKVNILPTENLYLSIDFSQTVNFHGYYDNDDIDNQSGQMMYPGDSGAIFLASIFVHAATAQSINDGALSEVQLKADSILSPYTEHINKFDHQKLVSCILKSIDKKYSFKITTLTEEQHSKGWLLTSKPVFYMTQDQKEIILKHVMFVHNADQPEKILYKNIIEISSPTLKDESPHDYWITENNLPLVSSELYAESIRLFIDDMLATSSAQNTHQKTFRYYQGGKRNYERGTLVQENCAYTTIRTLRGWIKSFPTEKHNTTTENNEECSIESFVDMNALVNLSE